MYSEPDMFTARMQGGRRYSAERRDTDAQEKWTETEKGEALRGSEGEKSLGVTLKRSSTRPRRGKQLAEYHPPTTRTQQSEPRSSAETPIPEQHPSPRLVFLSLCRNSRGVSSKTRLNGGHIIYLRRDTMDGSRDAAQFTWFKRFLCCRNIIFYKLSCHILSDMFKYVTCAYIKIIFTWLLKGYIARKLG